MVNNVFVRCNLCNSKFRLRWQVGYKKAAVQIRCPQCNSRIYGFLSSDSDPVAKIHGATLIDPDRVNYVQEISTEYLTFKMCSDSAVEEGATPFIRSIGNIVPKRMAYLSFLEDHPNEVETVNDLLNAKSYKYLKKKLRDDDNEYISICKNMIKKYILNSEVDLLMASHQYLMTLFLASGVNNNVAGVMNDIAYLRKTNVEAVKEFSKLMDTKGYYTKLNAKFSKLSNLYNENYISLVSTIMIKDMNSIDPDIMGLSSVDYEDLLELYRKCYEFIGEFIIYIIGLNNIVERGDYNEFKNGNSDIEEKVNKEDKYNRIQAFVKQDEKFSEDWSETLNKIIRNAEAHFDVEYDIISQKITFISKGRNRTDKEDLYLLELAIETIKIFGLSVRLWEIAYQLQKFRLILDLRNDWNYGRNK